MTKMEADQMFEQQMRNLREAARSIEQRDRPDAADIAESCRWAESRLKHYREQDVAPPMPANDIPQLVAKLDALLEDMAGQQAMTDDSWRQPYAEIRAALRLVLDALPTRERTCGTCASRYDSGACMRDVQDPGGEEILGTRSTFNWRNRDEFGCLQHDARTLGRDTETPR